MKAKKPLTFCQQLEDKILDNDVYSEVLQFNLPNGKPKLGSWVGMSITLCICAILVLYGSLKGHSLVNYGGSSTYLWKEDLFYGAESKFNSEDGL